MNHAIDRERAAQWARNLLGRNDWVILDTETTGLDIWSEVIQLAVIDLTGAALLDTLVKPTRPIPAAATRIHGITDAMVEDAPGFVDVYPRLCDVVQGKTAVVYNAEFDLNMLYQSMHLSMHIDVPRDAKPLFFGAVCWDCAMLQYAAFVGEWSDYHGDYRYQSLPGGDHSAIGDARATLRLIQRMAGVCNASITVPAMDTELDVYNEVYAHHRKPQPWSPERVDTPIEAALSAFVADLVGDYRGRSSTPERGRLAHAWFAQWRRDLGWRPVSEQYKETTE